MIDPLDKAILNELGANCRVSYQTIADKNGISATAVKKRVEKLTESGVIAQFIVELNLAMIDGEFYLALIQTDASVAEEEFITTLGTHLMISEAGALAGGAYIAFGTYIGSDGLMEIGKFLRTLKSVEGVEIHTLLFPRGKKSRLKKLHLRVLGQLLDDPRTPVTKIAKDTGLAARTVSRAIDEILKSESVRLSIRWNLNATDSITFLSKIVWDEVKINLGSLMDWLRREFPMEFWEPLISADSPAMFPAFVVDSLRDVKRITDKLQHADFITTVVTLIGKPSRSFYDLRRYRLEEMVRDISRP
jgi:DNA-binding Lrp family transcriptional regulator